jgi:hypothetical protein
VWHIHPFLARTKGARRMASISFPTQSVWDKFSADEKQQMFEEDRVAATRVSLILSSLAATGMILAAVTLVVVLLTI